MKQLALLVSMLALAGCYDFREDLFNCVRTLNCEADAGLQGADAGRSDGGGGVRSDGGFTLRTEYCSASGWCWQSELPKRPLNVIAALAPNDIWAMGQAGTITHFDGTTWKPVSSSSSISYNAGVVTGPHEFLVATTAGVLRWDGTGFKSIDPLGTGFSTKSIAAFPQGDGGAIVWAIRSGADSVTPMRLADGHWTQYSPNAGALLEVWGNGPDDVWLVGDRVTHWFDGGFSQETPPAAPGSYRAVWGSGGDVFVVGDTGTLVHRTESGWTSIPSGSTEDFVEVRGTTASDVWVLESHGGVRHWNGATLEPMGTLECTAWAIDPGHADSGVWVAGDCGLVAQHQSASWVSPFSNGPVAPLRAVHGSGPNDIWIVGEATLHWDGTGWGSAPISGLSLASVFSLGPTSTFAVDGVNFAPNQVHHWDGLAWRTIGTTPSELTSIWADATTGQAWSVGHQGTILLSTNDGPGFTTRALDAGTAVTLNAVAGSSATDVWVVGESGTILHSTDGEHFSPVTAPVSENLRSITVDPATGHAWITGTTNTILAWDGAQWATTTWPTDGYARTLSGTAEGFVTASVSGGIVRGPLSGLAVEESGTDQALHGVWTGKNGSPSIAVGERGTILAHQ